MKPMYAFVTSAILFLGGLVLYSQAESLKSDYYGSGFSLSDCQIGALGGMLGFQPLGVDTSGCDAQRQEIQESSSTSNVLFVGSAASLGFGIYLQRSSRKKDRPAE